MHRRYLIILLLIPLLNGCAEPTAESMLRDYTQRVSNALEHPVNFKTSHVTYPIFPPRRERRQEVHDLREGLIDVLRLRQCDLLPLISERNSNLGRVMTPSQSLQYELRFLPAIHHCEQIISGRIIDEPELSPLLERVQEIRRHKEKQLPKVIWNSVYTTPEMEQQFSRSASPLPLKGIGQNNQIQHILDPFVVIAQLADNPSQWPETEFISALEGYYENLYRTELGSQWLQSVSVLTYTMNEVSIAIEQRLSQRPICFNQQPNNRATIIQNVFRNFYAAEFQPYLASTDQFGQRWKSIHEEMISTLPVPHSTTEYFLSVFDPAYEGGFMYAYDQAKKRHTSAWQTLLDHCGLMAGQPH